MIERDLLGAQVERLRVQAAELARPEREALWPRVRLVLGALQRLSAERSGPLYGALRRGVALQDGHEIWDSL